MEVIKVNHSINVNLLTKHLIPGVSLIYLLYYILVEI